MRYPKKVEDRYFSAEIGLHRILAEIQANMRKQLSDTVDHPIRIHAQIPLLIKREKQGKVKVHKMPPSKEL